MNIRNQFFYKTKREVPGEAGAEPTIVYSKDSFNVYKVIRSVTKPDGEVVVLLDDFNERVMEVPDIDTKTNKFKGYKKVRETVQSEILLSKEDGERFFKISEIV